MSDKRVFISYASADFARVEPIVARLQSSGVQVVWDKAFAPGVDLREALGESIRSADHVVVAMSGAYMKNSWAQAELREALQVSVARSPTSGQRGGYLLPFLLDPQPQGDRAVASLMGGIEPARTVDELMGFVLDMQADGVRAGPRPLYVS